MITQLAHVCIGAKDLAETERFYTEILGLKKKFSYYKNNQLHGFYLELGHNTFIEVFGGGDGDPPDAHPTLRHFCVEVPNIDAFIETVRSRGWEVSDKKLGKDQSWQCWATDPNGVRIEFHHYTENSSQFTGEDPHFTS